MTFKSSKHKNLIKVLGGLKMLEGLQSIFDTLSTGVVVLNNKAEVRFLNKYMTTIMKKNI